MEIENIAAYPVSAELVSTLSLVSVNNLTSGNRCSQNQDGHSVKHHTNSPTEKRYVFTTKSPIVEIYGDTIHTRGKTSMHDGTYQ